MSPAGVVDAVVDLLLLWGKFMLEKKKKKQSVAKYQTTHGLISCGFPNSLFNRLWDHKNPNPE